MSNTKIEEIIDALEKIQSIANLLTSQTEAELAIIGAILTDISFPLLEKLRKEES